MESVKAKTNFLKIMNLKVFFLNNTLKILVYVRIKVIFYLDHVKKVDFQKRI